MKLVLTMLVLLSTAQQGNNMLAIIHLSVCLPGFVRATLCTTSRVKDYFVHHQPKLCTTDLLCAIFLMVHNGVLLVSVSSTIQDYVVTDRRQSG